MTIALAATGLLLSTNLAGCANGAVEHRPADVIAVRAESTPPADLLTCPEPAAAFPTDQEATIPPEIRAPLKALALGYRELFDRTERLINWVAPGTCPKDSQRP
jgi:hypothetical protein